MINDNENKQMFNFNCKVLFEYFFHGVILAEFSFSLWFVVKSFFYVSIQNNNIGWFSLILACSALILIIFVRWVLSKEIRDRYYQFVGKGRTDLNLVCFFGFLIPFPGFCDINIAHFNVIRNWIISLSWNQFATIILLPIVFLLAILLRKVEVQCLLSRNKKISSNFFNDREITTKNEDAFGFEKQVHQFSEMVYNNRSPESLVFGIDAPWGMGKSSFVNLCMEYLEEEYRNKIIVFKFDLLQYGNTQNVLEKFIEIFVNFINNKMFKPELGFSISKYGNLIRHTETSFSFCGITFKYFFKQETIDDAFEKLDNELLNIDKKIIIIIDNLDRIDPSIVMQILFIMKKVFVLHNVSYIICYDTGNFTPYYFHYHNNTRDKNAAKEKTYEFLEKFINVKFNLYINNKLLMKYFTDSKETFMQLNLLANPIVVMKITSGIYDIFNSNEFYRYRPIIGDARKIKRFVNVMILLNVNFDIDVLDINKEDLINLMLIYVNYPNLFRTIYDSETQGRSGFFSVVVEHNKITYEVSDQFNDFFKLLTDDEQFLLSKVFRKIKPNTNLESIGEDQLTSYACFNEKGHRNLENYLEIIATQKRPIPENQYKFYVNLKQEFLKCGKTIKQIFERPELLSNDQFNCMSLWKVIVNIPRQEFNYQKVNEVINYALEVLPRYSMICANTPAPFYGNRNSLNYYIAYLLDKVGWLKKDSNYPNDFLYMNNSMSDISPIADWIFGLQDHKGSGILDKLGQEKRGILGINDLLLFRLSCCANRDTGLFNISNALSQYEGNDAPIEGNTDDIAKDEMRKISQHIFSTFKKLYIGRTINIFEKIDELTFNDFRGNNSFTDNRMGEENCLKSMLKSFMVYQLGSEKIEANIGIGCGYYDVEGKEDKQGINEEINKYLFNVCFHIKNPVDGKNGSYFVEYLLLNSFQFGRTVFEINSIKGVLQEEKLRDYWRKHGNDIKEYLKSHNIEIYSTSNKNNIIFSQCSDQLYSCLDSFAKAE